MARFKTRARAVDMLGRQQIAGVPNAISELFKNAHDAYADHVEVDYFRSDGLFVLRDDGLGMTHQDFEDRWLTIGTESKLMSGKGIKQPPFDPTKKRRPITGEKGIGRLAIAVIGPQVLVLTRAKRGNKLHDLVAAFLHWGLFEAPGVNLEQIEIPVLTFPGGTLPSNEDIQGMVNTVQQNVKGLTKEDYIEKILPRGY
ncbi:MAG: ATP-binding protein [Chloroflexi bacterium]|nr:ATP-binding protein [Chloroflexota bacterium]